MDIEFSDDDLEILYYENIGGHKFQNGIAKSFRRRVHQIQSATSEMVLYQLRGLNYEKLKGNRSHEKSMRLNGQWRLILEVIESDEGVKILIKKIEDYH